MRPMNTFIRVLQKYDYALPRELIALKPASPRESARLLIYNRKHKRVAVSTFRNIGNYLPPQSVLVFNKTKVIPARLELTRTTGGRVRILYLGSQGKWIKALADRALRKDEVICLTRGVSFRVSTYSEKYYLLEPLFPIAHIERVFERYGHMPLPPYLRRSPLTERALRREYQTVFAKIPGSVAAPTASLHFTKALLQSLQREGHIICFITLHVNLGTFAPLTEDQLRAQQLHMEHYEIDDRTARSLETAKTVGRPIIAVGTTVVRALESAAHGHGRLVNRRGDTNLFIRPPYRFRFVDGLVTNFHVPKSSLMMLTAAFAGRDKLLELYRIAIKRQFRFFSFGDGMLIT